MVRNRRWIMMVVCILAVAIMAGCSEKKDSAVNQPDANESVVQKPTTDKPDDTGSNGKQEAPPTKSDPVTLIVAVNGPETAWKAIVEEPLVQAELEKVMPHVSFEYNHSNDLETLLLANKKIDFITTQVTSFYQYEEMGLLADVSDLVKKYNFDLSEVSSAELEIVRTFGKSGELVAIPTTRNMNLGNVALAYNKDIFDRFNVPYPEEGITWDEMVDLAKQFEGKDGYKSFVNYYAAVPMLESFGLRYTNDAGKADLSNPRWDELFRIVKRWEDELGNGETTWGSFDTFFKEKNIAMYAGNVIPLLNATADNQLPDLAWDMVSWPRLADMPVTHPPFLNMMVIPSTSEHRDEAFQLAAILASHDVQEQKKQDLLDTPVKDVNLGALDVSTKEVSLYIPNEYTAAGQGLLVPKLQSLKTKDINQAMREFGEELQQKISEMNLQK